jgi:archaellum biogenesis ATPase FlaH
MQKAFVGKIDGKTIEDGSVVLVKVPSKKLDRTNTELLKWYISRKKCGVVYVTVNKPFSSLIDGFKKAKIDTNKIFIIDAVTPRVARTGNAIFVGSPRELINISISTTSVVEKFTDAKIIVFDSLGALLSYNKLETVIEFIQFISNKMRKLKITLAIICIKEMVDEKALSQLNSFVDYIFNVK